MHDGSRTRRLDVAGRGGRGYCRDRAGVFGGRGTVTAGGRNHPARWTFGTPQLPGAYNNNYQILQTPDHVVIVSEMIHDTRIVQLDDRPVLAATLAQWHGDARGRWEGDTLVVESTNYSFQGAFRGATERLRLVERFTRVGPDAIQYEITADDPSTWDSTWTLMFPMTKTDQPMFEYACHEGNYGLENILGNARAEERVVAGTGR